MRFAILVLVLSLILISCSKSGTNDAPAKSAVVEDAVAAARPDAMVVSPECEQACKRAIATAVAEVDRKRDVNLAMGMSEKLIDDTRRQLEQSEPRCRENCARGLAKPDCLNAGTTWKELIGCGL